MLVPTRKNTKNIMSIPGAIPDHLTEDEINRLTAAYQDWFDSRPTRSRARHWVIFLLLRYTGARVSEILQLDDTRDIDFRNGEVIINTMKRRAKARRNVPIPSNVVAEIGRILATFPDLRGELTRISRIAVFNCFQKRAEEAGLPKQLRHPHVLRHTRAIELLRSGVPVTGVQQILGHTDISTTAIYLQLSGTEIKQIMRDRGLI
ncbi:MAG: tyrosine-type recombinase/integrase [Desulfonauticus sp.]|nr:tyrosine-type recombinase/integrase [Desulfonauticus sp.]